MSPIVFASGNMNKVAEISLKLGNEIPLQGLKDIGCHEDIPETSDTLEGNAQLKARHVYNNYHRNCFADDTGLEVFALNNAPGVYSARYAGEQKNPADNMALLLRNLENTDDRRARFRTVICLIEDGKEFLFEGVINGEIILEQRGDAGFGYDPVFVPEGYSRTFAEMTMEEKNVISHRAKAIVLLREHLLNSLRK